MMQGWMQDKRNQKNQYEPILPGSDEYRVAAASEKEDLAPETAKKRCLKVASE